MHRTRDLLLALERHRPAGPAEARSVARVRALVRWLPRPFDEEADPTHVTASAIVVDGGGRTLLHRHKRLGIWIQPGGHIERDEAPADAALREVAEETGLPVRHPDAGPDLLHVDVHEAARGHLHLDLRYLLLAPGDVPFAPAGGESHELAWLPYREAQVRTDPSAAAAIAVARDRLTAR